MFGLQTSVFFESPDAAHQQGHVPPRLPPLGEQPGEVFAADWVTASVEYHGDLARAYLRQQPFLVGLAAAGTDDDQIQWAVGR